MALHANRCAPPWSFLAEVCSGHGDQSTILAAAVAAAVDAAVDAAAYKAEAHRMSTQTSLDYAGMKGGQPLGLLGHPSAIQLPASDVRLQNSLDQQVRSASLWLPLGCPVWMTSPVLALASQQMKVWATYHFPATALCNRQLDGLASTCLRNHLWTLQNQRRWKHLKDYWETAALLTNLTLQSPPDGLFDATDKEVCLT